MWGYDVWKLFGSAITQVLGGTIHYIYSNPIFTALCRILTGTIV